jgi:selenide,water dikinase
MGARPILGLAVAAIPDWFPPEVTTAIFQGGADKLAEAGAVLAGGHTITDEEPKYGLCVTGLAEDGTITPKGGARPGDVLLLSKPLGTGIVMTALRQDVVGEADYDAAVASMLRLNRTASELAQAAGGAHGATDVTGFGLLGHAAELARNSDVCLRFHLADIPFFPGASDYVRAGVMTGGGRRNRQWLHNEGLLDLAPDLDNAVLELLFDPQTSGGLLLVLPPMHAERLMALAETAHEPIWQVGEVVSGSGVNVL